jgi:hypothetical protein
MPVSTYTYVEDDVREDDTNWPKKNIVGKQELEIRVGNDHIAFETAKIGSLVDVQDSEDPEGLRVFYYLVQDLKVSHLFCCRGFPTLKDLLAVSHLLFDFSPLQNQANLNRI